MTNFASIDGELPVLLSLVNDWLWASCSSKRTTKCVENVCITITPHHNDIADGWLRYELGHSSGPCSGSPLRRLSCCSSSLQYCTFWTTLVCCDSNEVSVLLHHHGQAYQKDLTGLLHQIDSAHNHSSSFQTGLHPENSTRIDRGFLLSSVSLNSMFRV